MKAKKNRGSTKGKAGKRAVKDLPAKSAASVKGGAFVEEALSYKAAFDINPQPQPPQPPQPQHPIKIAIV